MAVSCVIASLRIAQWMVCARGAPQPTDNVNGIRTTQYASRHPQLPLRMLANRMPRGLHRRGDQRVGMLLEQGDRVFRRRRAEERHAERGLLPRAGVGEQPDLDADRHSFMPSVTDMGGTNW